MIGVFCEGFDVTEQQRSEAALRDSEERYREIVEGAHSFAIVTVDESGIVKSWNRGAELVIGLEAAQATGRSIDFIFTEEDQIAVVPRQELERARQEGKALDERWHQRVDGTRFWGSGLTMALSGGGFLKIFRDSTFEHQARAKLEAAEAAAQAQAAERTATLGQLGPQIRVVVEADQNLPPAKADGNQVEMALLNLGVNARDAMPEGGTLRITADLDAVTPGHRSKLPKGQYIRLSVADTGVGMDDVTRERSIEPFFSTKGVGKGTGLGLSMVHGLASQLGGALMLQSERGLGTNVELWLPIAEVPVELPAEQADEGQSSSAVGTALLVDDEELVRISTADMLEDLGYSVVECGSAEEALRLLKSGVKPDLVITDHLMPGMNGTDLAHAILADNSSMPVLIISGYAEVDGISPDLPRLSKPFRKADLAASLAELNYRAEDKAAR